MPARRDGRDSRRSRRGATLGGWLAGDDGYDALAGFAGGVIGPAVGVLACIMVAALTILPLPNDAKQIVFFGAVVSGVAVGGATAAGVAYVTPSVVAIFVE